MAGELEALSLVLQRNDRRVLAVRFQGAKAFQHRPHVLAGGVHIRHSRCFRLLSSGRQFIVRACRAQVSQTFSDPLGHRRIVQQRDEPSDHGHAREHDSQFTQGRVSKVDLIHTADSSGMSENTPVDPDRPYQVVTSGPPPGTVTCHYPAELKGPTKAGFRGGLLRCVCGYEVAILDTWAILPVIAMAEHITEQQQLPRFIVPTTKPAANAVDLP